MMSVPTESRVAVNEPAGAHTPMLPGPVRSRETHRRLSYQVTATLRTAIPLVAVIVALSLYTNTQNSAFFTETNVENILAQVAVLGILAAGQVLLLIGGQIDLSVGSLVSLIGVLAAKWFAAGWSDATVVVVALLCGAGVGLVWGLIVAFLDVPPFILTLGGLSVFASLALVIANNTPIPVRSGLNSWGFGDWFGMRAPVVMLIVVVVVAGLVLHFTKFGRTTYALGSSRATTYLAGVPVRRQIILLFIGNSTLAALGGLLLMARLASGDPRSGSGLELSVIAVTVLGGAALAGGRGTMIGTFLGVLVFGVISAALVFLQVPGAYQSLVSGGILIVAVTLTAVADTQATKTSSGRGLSAIGGSLRRQLAPLISRRSTSP